VSITARELEDIVGKMLGEGVPAGVVSRVFELDIELVKDEQKKVRVRKYGTEDLNDYLEQMQWDAIEVARTILANGSPSEQSRYVSAILGKQMTAAAKRAPQGERDQMDNVMEMFKHMRGG
jgi:hypothetical protein